MPELSAPDNDLIRQFPQPVRRYLSIVPDEVVFSCQVDVVNLDVATNGIYSFIFKNVTFGAYTDVIEGMTVYFGLLSGDKDIGSIIIRKDASSTIVFVAETALGDVPIATDIYVTVMSRKKPSHKKPRLVGVRDASGILKTFTEYHYYDILYVDQNENIIPKANITGIESFSPILAGFVEAGLSYRDVVLSASNSIAMVGSIASILWDIDDGTYETGSSTDTDIVARFPDSKTFRYISLTVVDTNGSSHIMYLPMWVHNEQNYPITQFNATDDKRNEWREMSFELSGEDGYLANNEIPVDTAVYYWEVAKFGGDAMPDQYIYSYLGWITKYTENLKIGNRSTFTMNTAGLGYWIDNVEGFATLLIDNLSPSDWNQVVSLDIEKTLHYVLREYTNVLSLSNYFQLDINSPVKSENITGASPWSQLNSLSIGNLLAEVKCDSLGTIFSSRNFSTLEVDERALVDTILTLALSDWVDDTGLTLPTDPEEKSALVIATGSVYAGSGGDSTVIGAKAPGGAGGLKGGVSEMPFQRLPSSDGQEKLERLVGHYWAFQNNSRMQVTIVLIGNMDVIEPAWGEPVRLIWDNPNLIGSTLNDLFRVISVSVSHSNDFGSPAKAITIELSQATFGERGEFDKIEKAKPYEIDNITIEFPPITTFPNTQLYSDPSIVIGTPIIVPPTVSPFVVGIIEGVSGGAVKLTDDFDTPAIDGGPTWTSYALGLNGSPIIFEPDPFSARLTGGTGTVDGFIVTETHLYHISDIKNARTITELLVFRDTTVNRSFQISKGIKYKAVVVSSYTDGEYITISSDLFTWSAEDAYGDGCDAGTTTTNFFLLGGFGSAGLSATDQESDHDDGVVAATYNAGLDQWEGKVVPSSGTEQSWVCNIVYIPPPFVKLTMCKLFLDFRSGATFSGDKVCTIEFDGVRKASRQNTIHQTVSGWWFRTASGGGFLQAANSILLHGSCEWKSDGYMNITSVEIFYEETEVCFPPGLFVSSRYPVNLFTTGMDGGIGIPFDSDDGGLTLTSPPSNTIFGYGGALAGELHLPYNNNSSEQLIYYGFLSAAGLFLLRTGHDGETIDDISPLEGYAPYKGNGTIDSIDENEKIMLYCLADDEQVHVGVWYSTNSGDTMGTVIPPSVDNASIGRYERARFLQAGGMAYFIMGKQGKIGFSRYPGAAVDSRVGNINQSAAGEIVGAIWL